MRPETITNIFLTVTSSTLREENILTHLRIWSLPKNARKVNYCHTILASGKIFL